MEERPISLFALGTVDLRGSDGEVARSILAQPKRLALLAYLAVASPRGLHRRDRLLALFWPEFEHEQARHALRLALHQLRRVLGADVIESVGDDTIRVDASRLWCDVSAFEHALDLGDVATALAIYRGDLLDGLHVSDTSAAFEQWLDSERHRLSRRAARAAREFATALENAGHLTTAIHWARQAATLQPDDESALRRLLVLLDAHGDRAGALRAYDDFTRRMAREFDTSPSAETQSLIDAIRARATVRPFVSSTDLIAASESKAGKPIGPTPERRHWSRPLLVPALALGAAVLLSAVLVARRRMPPVPPIVAVGAIADRTGGDSAVTTTLRDLLATDLARVPNVRVVSHTRIYEILGQMGVRTENPERIANAARSAGATELLEGELYRITGDSLRLDLRREDLGQGVLRGAVSVEARDLFTLVGNATRAFALAFDLRPPNTPVTVITTSSLVAQRFYEEGLRAYYRSDEPLALRMFEAALTEDSTFAMAAYYAGRSAAGTDTPKSMSFKALAVRLAHRAGDRERLLIAQEWAALSNNPSRLTIAESLATRFPAEPDGELALGQALMWAGEWLPAIPHLRRAVALDSATLRLDSGTLDRNRGRCRACDAMGEIVTAYASVDSLDAAEREARLWIGARPRSYAAHAALAQLLDRQDRSDEALREYRASRGLLETYGRGLLDRVGVDLRTGSFASADQVLREIAETGDRGAQADGLFWLTISLRMQGRLNEALEVARKYRRLREHSASEAFAARRAAIPEAHVLLEQGREREAAALFDSIGAVKHAPPPNAPDSMPGAAAFDRIWALKRVGTALAAAGDTSRLSELADSVQSLGNLSAYVHDRRIHHHLRGLLWAARGRSDSAVREFEAAMYSSSDGSAETSLQLARALVRAGRPREAIHVLRAALHNFMDRAGFSTPRTEIQDALWQAYMAANERDSASVYARRVVNAWQHADPIFRDRVERARHAAAGPHPTAVRLPPPNVSAGAKPGHEGRGFVRWLGLELGSETPDEAVVETDRTRPVANAVQHDERASKHALVGPRATRGHAGPVASIGEPFVRLAFARQCPRRCDRAFESRRSCLLQPAIELSTIGEVEAGHEVAAIQLERAAEAS